MLHTLCLVVFWSVGMFIGSFMWMTIWWLLDKCSGEHEIKFLDMVEFSWISFKTVLIGWSPFLIIFDSGKHGAFILILSLLSMVWGLLVNFHYWSCDGPDNNYCSD